MATHSSILAWNNLMDRGSWRTLITTLQCFFFKISTCVSLFSCSLVFYGFTWNSGCFFGLFPRIYPNFHFTKGSYHSEYTWSRLILEAKKSLACLVLGWETTWEYQCYRLSGGHRTWKGQFSLQIQRKAMPKKAQITTELHLSHMLAK